MRLSHLPLTTLTNRSPARIKQQCHLLTRPLSLRNICNDPETPETYLPAIRNWFTNAETSLSIRQLNIEYLLARCSSRHDPPHPTDAVDAGVAAEAARSSELDTSDDEDTLVPLEITTFTHPHARHPTGFETVHQPLSLFLHYLHSLSTQAISPLPAESAESAPQPSRTEADQVQRIYLAQHPLPSLPTALQHDLPPPLSLLDFLSSSLSSHSSLTKHPTTGTSPSTRRTKTGADIYTSSLWLGPPPTNTPLHRDPNENLLVQLAGRKRIRFLRPALGAAFLREARIRAAGRNGVVGGGGEAAGHSGAAGALRGDEMMVGPEQEELDELVWGCGDVLASSDRRSTEEADEEAEEGEEAIYETTLDPGDAVFVPRRWWHSVRSEVEGPSSSRAGGERGAVGGVGVNCSVNWWFR